MENDDLRPCPECGGVDVDYEGDGARWRVHCWTCEHAGEYGPTQDEAQSAWNEKAGGR
jgi:hypothetical protein